MTPIESEPLVSQLIQEAACSPITGSNVRWKSGREARLIEALESGLDSLEIVSPEGELELTVRFTSEGARIVVPDGRLSLCVDEISVHTEKMKLKVKHDVDWEVGGTFRVQSDETQLKSDKDIRINGRFLKLNCDESGEVDEQISIVEGKLINDDKRKN